MDRRRMIAYLLTLPALATRSWADNKDDAKSLNSAAPFLIRSGAIASRYDGDVIQNLDVLSLSGDAITITHSGVLVRNCRIRHAGGHGVYAVGAESLRLESLDIEHGGAPRSGEGPNVRTNNIEIAGCPGAVVTRIKASKGAANVYLEKSERCSLSWLELHDARGPEPRGQNVQFNKCRDSTLEDFSAENGPSSWTEDNVSVFHSEATTVRRGLVSYNNSPSGVGVMLEGSSDCRVEDVDATLQGNGAFAAVPSGERVSGSCVFLRCRTAHSYNEPRDGREAPSSNGLSFYMRISKGSSPHVLVDCSFFALANPGNLLWQGQAVSPHPGLYARAFTPRSPLRLPFAWNT